LKIDTDLAALVTVPSFAVFTTLGSGGGPSSHVMWVDHDDEHLLINSEMHRQKVKNVAKDSLASW
jgi:general stress protein 26